MGIWFISIFFGEADWKRRGSEILLVVFSRMALVIEIAPKAGLFISWTTQFVSLFPQGG